MARRKRSEMAGKDYYHTTLFSTESEIWVKKMESNDKTVEQQVGTITHHY